MAAFSSNNNLYPIVHRLKDQSTTSLGSSGSDNDSNSGVATTTTTTNNNNNTMFSSNSAAAVWCGCHDTSIDSRNDYSVSQDDYNIRHQQQQRSNNVTSGMSSLSSFSSPHQPPHQQQHAVTTYSRTSTKQVTIVEPKRRRLVDEYVLTQQVRIPIKCSAGPSIHYFILRLTLSTLYFFCPFSLHIDCSMYNRNSLGMHSSEDRQSVLCEGHRQTTVHYPN
jgi:hypothetical protein